MAQQCPASVDVTDIQFKLQSKHKIFGENSKLRDHVNLLACASNHGLLFVGNPNEPELLAFMLPDIIYAKSKQQPVHVRTTKLPNVANTIGCNADGSMLAVNYTLQGFGVLDIYHVPSFANSDVKTLYSIRLPDQNVYALHILWNPVLSNIIGVVLSNGNFVLYTLKDGGAMEMRSLNNQQIQSGCWSPKGKQIVFGYPNGKLQQFKPDLTIVKSIICPPNIHPGPFDTIALHWLSTFQFVASFLQHGDEAMPNLYLINAPKGGTPVYINYNDVCYSGSEPRKQQVSFIHIAQWNLLLVTSANGVEIGLLGTKDSNDQPQWVHYMLLDEARIEMPLTEGSDETYPIGLALDISPTHQLIMGERKLDTMPVIHVLSTHGHLLCFNFLNLTENAVNICSPPAPIQYALSEFRILDEGSLTKSSSTQSVVEDTKNISLPPIEQLPPAPAPPLSFNTQPQINAAPQMVSMFGAPANKNLFSAGWEQKSQNLKFGAPPSSQEAAPIALTKPIAQAAPMGMTQQTLKAPQSTNEVFKPLYTVSPEFAPPTVQSVQQQNQQPQYEVISKSKAQTLNLNETNTVIQQMIVMQISSFDKEIKQLGQKAKLALNDDPSVMKSYSKRLINLQEIIEQANERDFIMDVQDLRHSLTESYEMLNECRTKLETYQNPDTPGVKYLSLYDCISQRQLKCLQSYLTVNQSIMKRLEDQMDTQWSHYQDLVRRNSRIHLRIPCLDGIYQQMTKLKNLITQQQSKLHYIKSIIKQKDLGSIRTGSESRKDLSAQTIKSDGGLVSLADSILSMTIQSITDAKSSKLSENKLTALRNFVSEQGKVKIIKPQRPNRVELTSEVILETKQLIKKKETKDKEAKVAAVKAQDVVKHSTTATFKPMQTQINQMQLQKGQQQQQQQQIKQITEQQQLQFSKATPTVGFFSNAQTAAAAATSAAAAAATIQSNQQTSTPFAALNFNTGSNTNIFAKTEPNKVEINAEMSKMGGNNSNTLKANVVAENKPNNTFAAAPNKTILPKPAEAGEKSPAAAANFSFTNKSDAGDAAKPAAAFNIASKGFAGFGQQATNANAPNTMFANNPNKSVVDLSGSQTKDVPKAFSFGNTFSALTDLKASAASNQSNLPPTSAPPSTLSSTTTMQPTIFNKQNDNPLFAPQALSFSAYGTGRPKTPTEVVQPKNAAETAALTKDAKGASVADSGDATKTTADTEDMILKSLNICKPTPKETVKPNEGNIFSFTSNNENNPPTAFQIVSDTKGTTPTNIATVATSTTTIFGKSATTTAAAEPAFSIFSGNNSTASAFGTIASSLTTATTTTAAPFATSTIGGAGSSAFSFTNSTPFKQLPLPTFQNPISASTTATVSSASVNSTTVAAPIAVAPASVATVTPATVSAAVSPTAAITVAATTTILTPTPSPTASAAAAVSSAAPVTSATTSFFSTIAANKGDASNGSIFGNSGQSTPGQFNAVKSENTPQQPTSVASVPAFGGLSLGGQAPAASGGSIFGNASSGGFGASTGGIFAAAAANSPIGGNTSAGSIFGNAAAKSPDTTAASIFGNAAAKPAENTSSIFGNAAAKSAENTGSSIFGGGAATAKPAESVSVFGSPTSTNPAVSSGSIFGQPSSVSVGGNIFAAAAAASKPDASATASGFSFVGSAFGGTANTVAPAGGSIFGGAAATAADPQQQQQPQQGNIFSSPNSGGFGGAVGTSPFSSFSQGGSSVANTGFGSPTQPQQPQQQQQQQQAGAFSRPIFGGAPTFGSPPAFGTQPSFGGAPTFGSPKGFGSFATPTTTAFSAPTTQSGNIFEALGATDTGLSFGNLAQTTNPPNAPKPMFGGSSFMNYRA
ncbi:unnamed protein product [Ceratitis capitata]|uniref:(Mediterranean fruit fly) hypothetical protein n=1 Tax=Ceratitis capitata TaxID=7213 RepID=A0A811VDY8_CERCA|nr:unnamed protein product [Ceratitis capitata]